MAGDDTPSRAHAPGPEQLVAADQPWSRDERGWIDIVGAAPAVPGRPASRFDGAYGVAYDAVMRRRGARNAAARVMWGRGSALPRLDELVRSIVDDLPADPVVIDLPCGAGAVWPLLVDASLRGTIVGCDLSTAMLERAERSAVATRRPGLDVTLVRGDALDLRLTPGIADAVLSINGLHCMPDIPAAIASMHRVLRTDSLALVTTMVDDGSRRHAYVARAARAASVVPDLPPTRATIVDAAHAAGFRTVTDLGGSGVAAFLFGS